MGFTPQLMTGVWMGYEEGGKTLDGLLNIGGRQFGPFAPPPVIWRDYMQKILQDKPAKKFEDVDTPQTLSTGTTGSAGTVPPAVGAAPTDGGAPPPRSMTSNPFPNQLGYPGGIYP